MNGQPHVNTSNLTVANSASCNTEIVHLQQLVGNILKLVHEPVYQLLIASQPLHSEAVVTLLTAWAANSSAHKCKQHEGV